MTIESTTFTFMVKDIDTSVPFYQSIGFTLANRWGNYNAQLTAPGREKHPRKFRKRIHRYCCG